MSDLRNAAVGLARRGLAVFPLSPGAKIPLAGSAGYKEASSDPAVAEARWNRMPGANVGIATGPSSGIWVLDIDAPDGFASLDKLQAEHGPLPATIGANSPSGGLHLYWKWPDGVELRNSASRIAPHIDVRAAGGSIVAPPSLLHDGRRYSWQRPSGSLEAAPSWLVALARSPSPKPRPAPRPLNGDVSRYVSAAVADEISALAGALEGSRNHALNRAAFSLAGFVLAGAIPEDWARHQLETHGIALGLTLAECRRTIQSAFDAATPRVLQ